MHRKTNDAGVELVKRFEGFRDKAYLCPAGKLTIGYGHVILSHEHKLRSSAISKSEGEDILKDDLRIAESAVHKNVNVELNDNQFSALVSFTFNLGSGNLKSSTLLKELNKGDYDRVPRELDKWVYANGVKLKGLVKRRKAEGELFSKEMTDSECCCPCHKK